MTFIKKYVDGYRAASSTVNQFTKGDNWLAKKAFRNGMRDGLKDKGRDLEVMEQISRIRQEKETQELQQELNQLRKQKRSRKQHL